ncbi:MAG: DMT family transporter [Alphaproteobacteria bacterium]|nr:DMT family transporter [Alphaproteobacteria bacterium]
MAKCEPFGYSLPMNQQQHRKGLFIVAMAPLAWSSAGLFTRAISTDLMTMLFWRGLFSGTAVFVAFFLMERAGTLASLRKLGWPALAVAVLSAGGMITGIGSLRYATVADAMVIYATVPFITAGIAYFTIGERPSRSTLIASAVALVGVLIMLLGAGFGGSMFGKMLALLMTFCMAGFSVLLRRNRDVPMLPAMAASAYFCAAFCFWFTASLSVSVQEIVLIGLFGIVQNAAGLIFYTIGSRLVPAAEATLIAALEVPLTPLWVLLFMGEVPSGPTMVGGAVVLAALFGHIYSELKGRTISEVEGFQSGV